MNYTPYSFSKISCYQECPFKFKMKYIDKIKIAPPEPRFFEKGKFYHSTLEHFPKVHDYKFKYAGFPKQEEFRKNISEFINHKHTSKLLDNKFGTEILFKFDESLNDFNGSKYKSTLYGFIDFIGECVYKGEKTIHIVDWKSKNHGKRFPSNREQLDMYAAWIFTVRPKLEKVITEFGYVENKSYTKYIVTREDALEIKKNIINNITTIETDEIFEHNKSSKCTKCDYFKICKPFNVNMKKD